MPNNPPIPVLNSIAVAKQSAAKCSQIKAKYNIKTRKHKKGGSGNIESHHILQDKAMTGLISKYSGHAILLTKSVHRRINAKQIARNCPGPGPQTFGELQKSARDDLKSVLKGKKYKGNKMTAAEAKIAADCLVAEAVKATQANRKKKNKKYLSQNSKVKKVKGCFSIGTLIWLSSSLKVEVEKLESGNSIETSRGPVGIVLTERCITDLVELEIGGTKISMAPFHRVLIGSGRYLRAELLREGHSVVTATGLQQIDKINHLGYTENVVNFLMENVGSCKVGSCGLIVDVPHLNNRVIKLIDITQVGAEVKSCRY